MREPVDPGEINAEIIRRLDLSLDDECGLLLRDPKTIKRVLAKARAIVRKHFEIGVDVEPTAAGEAVTFVVRNVRREPLG